MDIKTRWEEIPNEVLWVKHLQAYKTSVGAQLYKKAQSIINKYPEYFAWEHTYDSIPNEVHEAFERECYPEKSNISPEGILSQVNIKPIKSDKKDFNKTLIEFFEHFTKDQELKLSEENRNKGIWDKHYSKYGLEYRG